MLSIVFPATKKRIRELYISRFSTEELALMYDLSETRIKGIVRGLRNKRDSKII